MDGEMTYQAFATNYENELPKIKPCPFCGGEAELTGFDAPEYWVWCPNCKASTDAHTGKQSAIEAWNTRYDPQLDAIPATEENMARYGWVHVVRCRDCTVYDGEGYGCSYGRGDDPNGFCAWSESAWVTCKCGEDIERHDRIQVCPSCKRRLMA